MRSLSTKCRRIETRSKSRAGDLQSRFASTISVSESAWRYARQRSSTVVATNPSWARTSASSPYVIWLAIMADEPLHLRQHLVAKATESFDRHGIQSVPGRNMKSDGIQFVIGIDHVC